MMNSGNILNFGIFLMLYFRSLSSTKGMKIFVNNYSSLNKIRTILANLDAEITDTRLKQGFARK